MANELLASYIASRTVYFLVFNRTGQIWNNNSSAFENYLTANLANYAINGTQLGSASTFYVGNFPSSVVPGAYSYAAKQQVGGAVAESDPTIGVQQVYEWNGNAQYPRSDLSASGVVQLIPIYRGQMVKNFPVWFVSQADHVTGFTSGIVSGQISRDGGPFGPLQSGLFTEIGQGDYNLMALTSGDLLANTVSLLFTAVGISGGNADPRRMTIVLQRTSGQ